jgi:hypothetical protein|tara:strand:- start:4189 stop:4368 length:180 start_codon:yes stop_codon:yes gene_type:complete
MVTDIGNRHLFIESTTTKPTLEDGWRLVESDTGAEYVMKDGTWTPWPISYVLWTVGEHV